MDDEKTLVDPKFDNTSLGRAAKALYEATAAKREALAIAAELDPLPLRQSCFTFASVPTDICRVSPFFPLRQQDMANRPLLRGLVITESSWGKILYSGAKLSTYEEDVLYAILALLNSPENRFITEIDGAPTYTYKGPLRQILRLLGYEKTGKENYKRVLNAIELMQMTSLRMEINARTSRGKHKLKSVSMSNMISFAKWDEEEKELRVTINPYFYEIYMAGQVTRINLEIRSKLRSPVAKSLMRFVESHQDATWTGNMYKLAQSLNLDLNQPAYEIKRTLKAAITALIAQKVLLGGKNGSGLDGVEVTLVRASKSRPKANLRAISKR